VFWPCATGPEHAAFCAYDDCSTSFMEVPMEFPYEFLAADREFYEPLETARDGGGLLRPNRLPPGWVGIESGVWTQWHLPERTRLAGDGWKVHVSTRPERVQHVLDKASQVCFQHEVSFKHLSTRLFYQWTHDKLAQRPQSGKFIAAYPADVETARRLMEALRAALADERGPYILTDRRYKDSSTVYYRYGAFLRHFRPRADGTLEALTHDRAGRLVLDRRGASFHLPEEVVDPFAGSRSGTAEGSDFAGFAIDSSIRYTSAGGTYRGRELATGRQVFIKEARAHTGFREDGASAQEQLREEWRTLTALHEAAPGLAPEPIRYFRKWEHEFLVCEHVDGLTLGAWVSSTHPGFLAGSTPEEIAAYYRRCEQIVSALELTLDRLHAAGYVFIDLSAGNVIVGDGDAVRLVDFGSAHRVGGPLLRTGTPGFMPPAALAADDPAIYDDYGLSALTQVLCGPLGMVREYNPDALAHLHHDLNERGPIPPALWKRVTRYHTPSRRADFPMPEQVAEDPIRQLSELRDKVADALVAMADHDNRTRVFPTIPSGYLSNTICIAYGTAGVVHALRRAGRDLPDRLLDRLRRDALDKAGDLGPGLYVGNAGIARVLADCGLLDEARDLLAAADRHPLTAECADLFGGAAGVALTHLALYGHTGDPHHVDRAYALADYLSSDSRLQSLLEPYEPVGLAHGRGGVALLFQQLAGVTGDEGYQARAVRLLHSELDRAAELDAPDLLFPVSAKDRRAMPYLYAGSSGIAYTATRCLHAGADERLAEAMPRLLATLRVKYAIMSGLFQGLAGHAFTLADRALLTGDESCRRASLDVACGLFKYAVPHPTGMRMLGHQTLRYSADLWSGSAGVLLALCHVLDPRPDALFTVDALIGQRRTAAGPVPAGRAVAGVPAEVR
jgi:tRNA A-37 threonylcarbamoyl transferase component Bud32